MIVLSDQPYASVFGPASPRPTSPRRSSIKGELLVRYYAVAHEQLANEVALLSGQGPTVETAANCPTYRTSPPPLWAPTSRYRCRLRVPARHPDARRAAGRQAPDLARLCGGDRRSRWQDGRPAAAIRSWGGRPNAAGQLPAGAAVATFRNPFVYFRSLTDSPTCAADDVGLRQLSADLANAKRTPSLSYIVPDRCHDGSPTPCASGAPGGLAPADGFLRGWSPRSSPRRPTRTAVCS